MSSPNVGLGADESLPLSQDEVREKLPRSLYSKDEGGLDDGERWKRRKLSIPPPPVQLRPPPSVRATKGGRGQLSQPVALGARRKARTPAQQVTGTCRAAPAVPR